MRYAKKRFVHLCLALASGLAWHGSVAATDGGEEFNDPVNEWVPVSSADLDELRGGFDTASGLRLSFGIQREVYVNDNLVAATQLTITDINSLTGEQARAIADPGLHLIQNGSGNHFDASAITQSAAALVIQNTLSQQDIRSLTMLNARANSLELLKNLNLQSVLTEAIGQAIVAR